MNLTFFGVVNTVGGNKMKDDSIAKKSEEIAKKISKREKGIFNKPRLQESVRVYEYLQNEFNKKGADIASDPVFKFLFRSYYGLDNAKLTPDFENKYFELMKKREQDLSQKPPTEVGGMSGCEALQRVVFDSYEFHYRPPIEMGGIRLI